MRSEARIDSLVFQLTPTRTRCDLVILASGKPEKIASGLLNPFLTHLKAAQDQISKGGYSITLEPDDKSKASWFTKGTVERFVRFVSTPEIVERAGSIESEILQIENAIVIQNNEKVNNKLKKLAESTEGNKSSVDDDAEKAIVLYKPGSAPNAPDSNGSSNGSTTPEEDSKVQLLRVLETRKIVLQKEQAMAFARAVAAGFDIDAMTFLISFSESFGASRLKEACLHFMKLWKQKHETGQWIEVEAMPESGFPYLNGSGIVLSVDSIKEKELGEPSQASIGDIITENENQVPSDGKVAVCPQDHVPNQLQQPMYSQWPMYPPSGPPGFPSYQMPGVPCYNYHGGVPYFHPAYPPPVDDPRFSAPRKHKKGSKRHTMDERDSNNESEESEQSTGSQDGGDGELTDFEKESSHHSQSHKKGRSGKKKPGVVVIKNLNYIARKFGASGSDSQSDSDSESEEETENSQTGSHRRNHKHLSKASTKEYKNELFESLGMYNQREDAYEPEADSGNWQAFQSFLTKAEEKTNVSKVMFLNDIANPVKGKESTSEVDPLVTSDRGYEIEHVQGIVDFDSANGSFIKRKPVTSNDDVFLLSEEGSSADNQLKEIRGEGSYRKMTSDEFLIYKNEKQLSSVSSSDPSNDHAYEHATKVEKISECPYDVTDDSFMLPYRSASSDHLEQDSSVAIYMGSELPTALIKVPDSPKKDNSQYVYEPDDFYLITDREIESVSISYDPAFEYDIQVSVQNVSSIEAIDQDELSVNTEEEANKSEKDKKPVNGLEKRMKDALVKRGTPSRMNPLAEAQKRAEKLRTYKADLQKMKKEQEEEKLKRLEALKLERQKRIAVRSSSNQLPVSKLSVPPSKLPGRTNATVASDSKAKSNKINGASNGLARSASSLAEVKKDSNDPSLQIKRLSEPKGELTQLSSSVKSITKDQGLMMH